MKPIAATVGIAVFLVSSTMAQSILTWDGDSCSDANFGTAANWTNNTVPGPSDTAKINDLYTPSCWPVLDQDHTVNNLRFSDIDASASVPVQLSTSTHTLRVLTQLRVSDDNGQVSAMQTGDGDVNTPVTNIIAHAGENHYATYKLSSGTLYGGTVTVQAKDVAGADATIEIAASSIFEPTSMAFDGGSSDSYGCAIGIFDESVPPDPNDAFPITAQEYVSIQVKSDEILTATSMTVGVYNTTSGDVSISRSSGDNTGTVYCPSGVTINGGISGNTTFTVSSGARFVTTTLE